MAYEYVFACDFIIVQELNRYVLLELPNNANKTTAALISDISKRSCKFLRFMSVSIRNIFAKYVTESNVIKFKIVAPFFLLLCQKI